MKDSREILKRILTKHKDLDEVVDVIFSKLSDLIEIDVDVMTEVFTEEANVKGLTKHGFPPESEESIDLYCECLAEVLISKPGLIKRKGCMMHQYRKKPVVIEAVQWFKHGDHPKVQKYGQSTLDQYPEYEKCGFVETLEGNHHVIPSDWIIKGVKGEHYPCKEDIFNMTYDKVD